MVISNSKIGIIVGKGGLTETDIIYSTDDGVTWGNAVKIANGSQGLYEAAFQYVGSNTIIGVMRAAPGSVEVEPQFTYSTDGGTTWATPVAMQMPFNTTQPSYASTCTPNDDLSGIVSPWITPLSYPAGKYLLVYTERQHCPGGTYSMLGLLQGIIFDPAAVVSNVSSFGSPTTLLQLTPTSASADMGYPTLTELSSQHVNMSFYQPKTNSAVPVMYSTPLTIGTLSFTLTTSLAGAGTGNVQSGDGHINCPGACSETVVQGADVDLTATASIGSVFGSWAGCTSSSNNVCHIIVNGNATVTATFNLSNPSVKRRGSVRISGTTIMR